MITLSLIWLLLGLLIGLLTQLAQLQPHQWTRAGKLVMMGSGMVLAFCGGWLGVLLLGRFFSTAMALWVACIGILILSRTPHSSTHRSQWRHPL